MESQAVRSAGLFLIQAVLFIIIYILKFRIEVGKAGLSLFLMYEIIYSFAASFSTHPQKAIIYFIVLSVYYPMILKTVNEQGLSFRYVKIEK